MRARILLWMILGLSLTGIVYADKIGRAHV